MRKVYERLYTGDLTDCFEGAARWVVVHACRKPCFRRAAVRLGIANNSQTYIEDGQNLYLDLLDGPAQGFSTPLVEAFLSFADRYWSQGFGVLIHCDQGISRGPSLCLLFLAAHSTVLPRRSYAEASVSFSQLLPGYSPSEGIRTFLREKWGSLCRPLPTEKKLGREAL